ncbi:Transcriptional regulator, LacI family (plasmid) [Cupriavidus necator H850]|uniref:LacI family DNA-binding transcriptional regulator n=1 Tax=Cupriavidus necator TaxID=106590 RepID=UPI0023ED8FC9|nr:LacI family DNA-binding transcriptional regulator [Cupriavidus necator]KAI3603811.1 Transcriptional regulator, LacI family [Cupriavidus necator H850]
MRRTRLEDVAKLAGVSMATVSRALSSPSLVREKTLVRVRNAVEALSYVPDASARTLASGRSRTVAAVVPTLDNAIFSHAIQGMQEVLGANNYQLLLGSHNYNPDTEINVVRALSERAVDAMVLVGADHAPETLSILRQSGTRTILTWSLSNQYPCVGFDNFEIGAQAARYLFDLGHRRFGMISGIASHNDRARLRTEGFVSTLRALRVELPRGSSCEQPYTFAGGRTGLRTVLEHAPTRPTAIFCGNDVLALGCLFEAMALGLEVPKQLSIVGCDDLPISAEVTPALTTIALESGMLGRKTGQALLRWLQEGVEPGRTELPVSLVQRDTAAPPPQ